MAQQLEAVFEGGILRPLQPLMLAEQQHVLLTISDLPGAEAASTRHQELEWLKAHSEEHLGEWVALDGNQLVSHGSTARTVRDESRRKGIQRPLLVRIPDEADRPSAGWL